MSAVSLGRQNRLRDKHSLSSLLFLVHLLPARCHFSLSSSLRNPPVMFVKEEVVRDLFKNLFVDAQSPPSALHLEEYQQQKDEKTVSSFDALLQQRRSQRQTLRHQQLNSYTTPWTHSMFLLQTFHPHNFEYQWRLLHKRWRLSSLWVT